MDRNRLHLEEMKNEFLQFRKQMGWTREELARLLGVRPEKVKKWEEGKESPTGYAQKLWRQLLKDAAAGRLVKMVSGVELRRFREEMGWDQEAMAQRLGVCLYTVSRWEHDRHRPCYHNLVKLNRLLKRFWAGRKS